MQSDRPARVPDGAGAPGQGAPGELLDIAQVGSFVVAAEGVRNTGRTGASGSADAVDIVFRHVRQLEIDDVRHAFDIDPACGDVGGHEHSAMAGAEAGERAFALRLRFVAVNGGGFDAGADEMPRDPVRTMLCSGEDEHPREGGVPQ
jgi:hypothetical protein